LPIVRTLHFAATFILQDRQLFSSGFCAWRLQSLLGP
jgi:hypothetical protein